MDSQILTLSHVAISLVGILSGVIVAWGLITNRPLPGLTAIFLLTTVATSVTGFFFHRDHILPSHIVGLISLLLLAAAITGLYLRKLRGAWRGVYVVGAVASLYLNVFVLIVQSFLKIPALNALAPTQSSEPAFAGSQGAALLLFIVIGILSFKRFRPASLP
ncbi:MAG TPA: hypothetical protein VNW15_02500 [Rhizomicrobium sp.]|jgi:hypothetical protein|nr:hypothetical protein [Rhizomicrobium sp.]